ncbi:MATH domain and coiled-coil domain-containing protein At3g58250-like [Salvia splendens]|uniref:MATH domain and coiled-coil domain-containing protein At3g58250-like n=1 Tax=Salvia splendens TaxID=180675 RepID=UPI001C2554BA|nr:MATH domain and coiled-coil domain-containing protein At3g58250-like [Salvia splendens]
MPLNRLKGYIVDDVCVFGAEVFVLKTQLVVECLSLVQNSATITRDWKIYGFSKLVDLWVSEEFVVANHKWRVQVYPKGNDSGAKGRFVSVYLECVSAKSFAQHQKIKAEVEIRIGETDDGHFSYYSKFDHWFRSSMDHWGHDEFIPICDMRNFRNEDCVSLRVEVHVEAIVS